MRRVGSIIESVEEPENSEITSSSRAGLAIASMVNDEVGDLLAVMRRTVIWLVDELEPSLMQSLKALRKRIFSWQHHWHTINPVSYLRPFLDVIRSDEMGTPVTSAALSSVYKILTSDALELSSVSIEAATQMVVDSVTSCRFEVTDSSSEEVVLMKVLQVLLACMKGKTFMVLSNQHVCTIVNTCFRIFHQAASKGELLQEVARDTIHELIRRIFAHLPDVANTENLLVESGNSIKNEVVVFDVVDHSSSNKLENGGDNHQPTEAVDSAEPSAVPCMVEIFQFLCSLLNVVEHEDTGPTASSLEFDEDVPLFTLDLINSAIELSGPAIRHHPQLLSLVQDELFCSLMEFGLSMSPLILSKVCSIVFNLYLHLRMELKLQLEAFFSCVILRLSQSRYGASYEQKEAVMEALVSFCRQKDFAVEMYANFDCDTTCTNLFEELANLLSKSAFPVNGPLSPLHILALDGLIALVQNMAGKVENESSPVIFEEYAPFWMLRCENFNDWVSFVRRQKYVKKRLMIGADHFNRDPKKGLEFLQGSHLLPAKLDPQSVACFFKYAAGLNKFLVGEFLGNHDDFCVQVLHEFVRTFDFQEMNLDTALRLFLETFRLPGESQKIQRVLEAFSERYYEQSPQILANKDAALVLSYSIIMLNTDLHNVQVKNKMSEEDFIRNNRNINDGNDLPSEFLSEIYFSICRNEIQTTPEQGPGFAEMTPSRWMDLMNRSKNTTQYIVPGSTTNLNHEMFALISGPTVAALFAVFDSAEHEEVCQTCIDGFLAIADISACHDLKDILDDLIVSLCKSTTLLNNPSSNEEPGTTFAYDSKAQMATVTAFTIAKRYGDFICSGWKYILDCILRLHKLGLLPELRQEKPLTSSSSLSEPSQRAQQMIQECHIDRIFMESEFLRAESLLQLARVLMKGTSSPEDEDSAVFCLELLIAVILNNRDRIELLWQGVYDHVSGIIQSSVMPCAVVENAVLELLRICQKLLPYKYNLADEMLRSLHMVKKPPQSHNT